MDGYVIIETKLNTSLIDKQIDLLQDKLEGLVEEYEILEKAQPFEGQNEELIKLGNEIDKTRKKIAKLSQDQSINFLDMGKGIQNVTKKLGKMALAIFGIRSAYMFIRNSINTLANEDAQLKADIDYIKTAIAYSIEPLVRGIINLVKTLSTYIAYIIKVWTGRNIFENANKSLKNTNAQANKLKKTLAGFDEMNVLSDQNGAGGTTNAYAADINMPTDEEMEGTFIGWIAKNKDIVISALAAIGAAITALKLGTLLQNLELFSSLPLWKLVGGLALVLVGLGIAIKGVIDFINDPSWQNFLTILEGIALVVAGIAVLMGGWIVALVALGVAIVAYVIKNWNKVKEILGSIGGWIYDKIIVPVGTFFANLWNGFTEGASKAWEGIKNIFSTVAEFFGKIFTKAWEKVKAVFSTGGKIFTGIKDGIVNAFKKIVNAIIDGLNKVVAIPFNGINWALQKIRDVDLWGWKPFDWIQTIKVPQIPRLAKGTIASVPSRGIPTPNGIYAEAGREAYLPLSDTALLEELGSTLGKYISLNATIPVYVGNRQVAREIRKINADEDFAYNK